MKTRITLLVAVTAIITLSFTFGSTKETKEVKTKVSANSNSVAGGLASHGEL